MDDLEYGPGVVNRLMPSVAATAVMAVLAASTALAEGHGPAFALATPTLGKGQWSSVLGLFGRWGVSAGVLYPVAQDLEGDGDLLPWVKLKADNGVTREQIRLVIRENGFTPKDAVVVVSGTLTRVEDRLVLATNADRQYSLHATPDAQSAFQTLQAAPEGAMVQIEARVGEGDTSRLSVLAVRPESLAGRHL